MLHDLGRADSPAACGRILERRTAKGSRRQLVPRLMRLARGPPAVAVVRCRDHRGIPRHERLASSVHPLFGCRADLHDGGPGVRPRGAEGIATGRRAREDPTGGVRVRQRPAGPSAARRRVRGGAGRRPAGVGNRDGRAAAPVGRHQDRWEHRAAAHHDGRAARDRRRPRGGGDGMAVGLAAGALPGAPLDSRRPAPRPRHKCQAQKRATKSRMLGRARAASPAVTPARPQSRLRPRSWAATRSWRSRRSRNTSRGTASSSPSK